MWFADFDGAWKYFYHDCDEATARWAFERLGPERFGDTTVTPVAGHDGRLWLDETDTDSATTAVLRYDLASGTVRRASLKFPPLSARTVVHGDIAYVLAYGGSLVALDTGKSTELWHLETSVSTGSEPVVAGDRLYFTAGDGRLLAVGTRDGDLLGQTNPRLGRDRGTVPGSLPPPIVVGGTVYAAAPDGTLSALNARKPGKW